MTSKDERARGKSLKDEYVRADRASQAAQLPLDEVQLDSLLTFVTRPLSELAVLMTSRPPTNGRAAMD